MQVQERHGEAGTRGRDHAADLSGTLYETVLLAILEGLRSAYSLLAFPCSLHILSLPADMYCCSCLQMPAQGSDQGCGTGPMLACWRGAVPGVRHEADCQGNTRGEPSTGLTARVDVQGADLSGREADSAAADGQPRAASRWGHGLPAGRVLQRGGLGHPGAVGLL